MKIEFEIKEIDFPKSSNNSFEVWCVPRNIYAEIVIWILKKTGSKTGLIISIDSLNH